MIISEEYIILNEPYKVIKKGIKLCIINYNIIHSQKEVKKLINSNPTTTFWATTTDYSKEYVLTASKLGISNLVQFPINIDTINNFFKEHTPTTPSLDFSNYAPLKNSKILIVDDNALNISLLKEILSDIGIDIVTCQNPLDSIKLVENEKFDLLLLDILMNELSGFELAEIVKKTYLNKDSKIIFISAVSGDENVMNGYNLGAFSYIKKPFSPSLVKAQIYNILKSEEEKKEADKTKENFVATLTHDLKSPINAEIYALKYLLKNYSNDDINKDTMLFELLNSAQYMKHITDKILCHYKQKNNKFNLKKEYTNFYNLIMSSIEEMKFLAFDKNIEIRFNNQAKIDTIYADTLELKRVISNLLSNAIEYSFKNSYIDIILKNTETEYIVTIQDYGIGIDLNKHTKIFDEYITLSKEQKKVGFGLGLNISQSIIKAHNGNIEIQSSSGKGTIITIKLPIE